MKKVYLKFLFTFLLLLCSIMSSAQVFEVDEIYYNVTSETEVCVSNIPCDVDINIDRENIIIPPSVTYNGTTYRVTSISEAAFLNCYHLTNLSIPASVKHIEGHAFNNCPNLANITVQTGNTVYDSRDNCNAIIDTHTNTLIVGGKNTTIPNSVTGIGFGAFSGRTSLTNITIPNSIRTIDNCAFDNCTSLTSVTIPGSVTTINWYVFRGCTGLTSVVISDGVTTIDDGAFRRCENLANISIPNSVTSIDYTAFEGTAWYENQHDGVVYAGKMLYNYKGSMPANTSITIKEGTLGIVDYAFSCQSNLTSITIPGSVKNIGSKAFFECCNLMNLELNEGIESIGNSAFEGCTSLSEITIPNSVTSIGDYVFKLCGQLASITIGDGVDDFGYDVFKGCTNLVNITLPEDFLVNIANLFTETAWYNNQPDGVVYIGKTLYKYKGSMPENTSITIKEGTLNICIGAFSGCTGLTKVTMPNSLKEVGNYAFENCTGLSVVTIPDSVTTIGYRAFTGCTGLTDIKIGRDVKTIGGYSFCNCSSLKNIGYSYIIIKEPSTTLPGGPVISGNKVLKYLNNVASIGEGAFYNCRNLKSIWFGDSLKQVGEALFSGCDSLKTVSITSGNKLYDSRDDCNAIIETASNTIIAGCKATIIPSSVINIGKSAFIGCTGLTSITIPNNVTTIGNQAFADCTGLTSITIPNSVTTIESRVFEGCTGLTSVTLPNSVTKIEYSMFVNCTGLTNIKIPDSVTNIGECAFKGCTGLTSIVIPNSVIAIGYEAFQGCASLESITIPNSVTTIERQVFLNCTGLKSITIPNSVTTIGYQAFYNCTGLTSIVIPNSVTNIETLAFYNCTALKTVTNFSPLNVVKGATTHGYVAYYADEIINVSNGSIEGDFVFAVIDSVNVLTKYLPKDNIVGEKLSDWTSTNKTHSTTSQKTYSFSVVAGDVLTFDWNVSSESNYDWLIVTLDGTEIIKKSGAYSGTYTKTFTLAGTHTMVVKYTKDGSSSSGSDTGKVYNINISKTAKIVLPENYKGENYTIGAEAFKNITGISQIAIPNSVTSIGDYAFYGCTNLTGYFTIPSSITSIANNAFSNNCTKLTGFYLLNESLISSLITYNKPIYIPGFEINTLRKNYPNTTFRNILNVNKVEDGLTSLKFTIGGNYGLVVKKVIFNENEILPNEDGIYTVLSLSPATAYNITTICEYEGEDYTLCGTILTNTPSGPSYYLSSRTQTTLTFTLNMQNYGEDKATGAGMYYGEEYYAATNYNAESNTAIVTIENLTPGTDYSGYNFNSYAEYYGVKYYNQVYNTTYSTLPISIVEKVNVTATTILFKCNNIVGDASFVGCGFIEDETAKDSLFYTGLEPNTSYTVTYYVDTREGGRTSKTITAKTDALIFKTLPAKATSDRRAVICAEVNIPNEEVGTGFEWRRYDAPDLVPSNMAGCAIHEGVIEGALNNLNVNTYYKYRPYYCSAAGNYYYGDWLAFGTADAYVYFTPTVHTYAVTQTASNAVYLKGYALAGSDNILEQGFEYWIDGSSLTRSTGEKMKITASGQRMNVLLEGLKYGKKYKYRAYVTTANETVYGEIQMFAIPARDLTGDVDGDGVIDVADATTLVSMILDNSLATDAADVDGDGTVDVADATALVSIILGTDTASAAPAKAAATRAGEISTVSADGDGSTLLININNPGYPFSAIQFDLELPEGIEVDFDGEYYAVDLGSRTNSRKHSYPECAIQPDGSLRVVIISMSNALYNGTTGDVATATLKVNGADDGDYQFTIKNVVLSAPGSKEKLEPYTGWINVTGGVTGISEIKEERAESNDIYDLQGRKVTEPVKGGIYIVNGKKVIW